MKNFSSKILINVNKQETLTNLTINNNNNNKNFLNDSLNNINKKRNKNEDDINLLKENLIDKKISRIPFYSLEEMKKISEKKLENIHKTEKKEKINFLLHNKKPLVERRKDKMSKKQKLLNNKKKSSNNLNDSDNNNNNFIKNNKTFNHENLHDLKYSQLDFFPAKKYIRISKKQQKIQNP
jgi:hypothetical protein